MGGDRRVGGDRRGVKSYLFIGLDNSVVPMGGYDSSQIADLVGLYILNMLARIINPQQVGLYRDDGLLYIPNSDGPLSSSIQKGL